jgi:hypothetical protein
VAPHSYRGKTRCSQCGQIWRLRACGPTHALIWWRIKQRNKRLAAKNGQA